METDSINLIKSESTTLTSLTKTETQLISIKQTNELLPISPLSIKVMLVIFCGFIIIFSLIAEFCTFVALTKDYVELIDHIKILDKYQGIQLPKKPIDNLNKRIDSHVILIRLYMHQISFTAFLYFLSPIINMYLLKNKYQILFYIALLFHFGLNIYLFFGLMETHYINNDSLARKFLMKIYSGFSIDDCHLCYTVINMTEFPNNGAPSLKEQLEYLNLQDNNMTPTDTMMIFSNQNDCCGFNNYDDLQINIHNPPVLCCQRKFLLSKRCKPSETFYGCNDIIITIFTRLQTMNIVRVVYTCLLLITILYTLSSIIYLFETYAYFKFHLFPNHAYDYDISMTLTASTNTTTESIHTRTGRF